METDSLEMLVLRGLASKGHVRQGAPVTRTEAVRAALDVLRKGGLVRLVNGRFEITDAGKRVAEEEQDLEERLKESADAYAAMSPEEKEEMKKAQAASWVRGNAPCEHGIADWENCPDCRAQEIPDRTCDLCGGPASPLTRDVGGGGTLNATVCESKTCGVTLIRSVELAPPSAEPPDGFLTDCIIKLREDHQGKWLFRIGDGTVVARLKGYAIIPREDYETQAEALEKKDETINALRRRIMLLTDLLHLVQANAKRSSTERDTRSAFVLAAEIATLIAINIAAVDSEASQENDLKALLREERHQLDRECREAEARAEALTYRIARIDAATGDGKETEHG